MTHALAASIDADPMPRRPRARRHPARAGFVAMRGQARWQQACALVADQYEQSFGAQIQPDFPRYLGLAASVSGGAGDLDPGAPVAVVGARGPGEQPLFCQRYLGSDLAAVLEQRTGRTLRPAAIVELGNLALLDRRLLTPLFCHVHTWTLNQGFDWIVFCLTREVRAMLEGSGAALIELGPARPEKVGADRTLWGDYYRHSPAVMAASTHQSPFTALPWR